TPANFEFGFPAGVSAPLSRLRAANKPAPGRAARDRFVNSRRVQSWNLFPTFRAGMRFSPRFMAVKFRSLPARGKRIFAASCGRAFLYMVTINRLLPRNMPPRWGFWLVGGGFYNQVGPSGPEKRSLARRKTFRSPLELPPN